MKDSERIMKDMKKENEEIFLKNSEYLQASATKYLGSNAFPKLSSLNKSELNEQSSYKTKPHTAANTARPNRQQQITDYSDISDYDNISKVKNFKYVNNRLRSDLMRAFLKYNPKIHHDNVMKLADLNPDIKK